jgi:hypothetical protein
MMERYIVHFKESSDGPQCNNEKSVLIKSPRYPTEKMLDQAGFYHTGTCYNVGYPGCDDCGGSYITKFEVKPFSIELAVKLGLIGKDCKTDDISIDKFFEELKPES